jgi:hypothetical protein
MPIPTVLADLSPIAASNYPAGSNAPSTLDDVQRAHAAFIAQIRDAIVPVGGILPYSGSTASLTANWKVCDGTGGTPDLRDKFIVGSGTSYALGASGGSKDLIVPTHTHTATFAGSALAAHGHTLNDPSHTHAATFQTPTGGAGYPGFDGSGDAYTTAVTGSAVTGITLDAVSAGTPAGAVTVASTGASATGANLPPYYALIYIQRVS